VSLLLSLPIRRLPPISTLFPYTTLFRSTREDQRTLFRWRGENAFIAHLVEHHAAHQLVKHGGSPHIRTAQIFRRTEAQFRKRLRSEEHTSELQSRFDLVCRLLLEKKK